MKRQRDEGGNLRTSPITKRRRLEIKLEDAEYKLRQGHKSSPKSCNQKFGNMSVNISTAHFASKPMDDLESSIKSKDSSPNGDTSVSIWANSDAEWSSGSSFLCTLDMASTPVPEDCHSPWVILQEDNAVDTSGDDESSSSTRFQDSVPVPDTPYQIYQVFR
jgi:hypothetical protein